MYLRECNVLSDPSLMSTGELKENYARVSNVKSMFGESLSSGHNTPNLHQSRIQIEVASPHFSNIDGIMRDEVDLQVTGTFSSVGSRSNIIHQSSKNARYSRL